MKNLLVLVLLVSTTTLTAQIFGIAEEEKYEASVDYLMGKFTDDFTDEIYSDGFNGFEISATRTLFVDWAGLGLFYKSISADGVPVAYGYEGVGETAKIDINTWGPEVFIKPFKFLKVYARYGFVNFKEELRSNIGDFDFDENGSNLDLGLRGSVGVYKGLNLILRIESSTTELKDVDIDGAADRISYGLGVGYKF